jgi:hypothetical protein
VPASGVLSALSILLAIFKVESLLEQARDELMVDVHAALGGAGLRNVHVREYVRYWPSSRGPHGSRSSARSTTRG